MAASSSQALTLLDAQPSMLSLQAAPWGAGTVSNELAQQQSVFLSRPLPFPPPLQMPVFYITDMLVVRSSALKQMLLQVIRYLDAHWMDRIFAQLDDLMDPQDWGDDDLPTQRSFSTFLRLIVFVKPTKVPGLGLHSGGVFIANWSHNTSHLTIECDADDLLRWSYLIRDDEGSTPRVDHGECTIPYISDAISLYTIKYLSGDGSGGK